MDSIDTRRPVTVDDALAAVNRAVGARQGLDPSSHEYRAALADERRAVATMRRLVSPPRSRER
jgi:hypothetical protein